MNTKYNRTVSIRVLPLLASLLLTACADLAFVKPIEGAVDKTPVTTGTLQSPVPIQVDFTSNTSARNIILDGNNFIGTAPGFTTAAGAGQDGRDRVSGSFPMSGGNHTLTASAEFRNWLGQTQTISKTVNFVVAGPLPDLEAVIESVDTFRGSTAIDFEIRIYNLGPTAANNIALQFFTNVAATSLQIQTSAGFSCSVISGGAQRLEVHCTGGNIGGNQPPATLRVRAKPTNALNVGSQFTLFGTLDTPPAIQESNESNNNFTKTVMTVL